MDGELKKLISIVKNLFTLSMADAGQLSAGREPIYLNEVLEQACAVAAPLARAKRISIERSLDHELPYTGDEFTLRQLFLIFLDNAIRYSATDTRVRVNLTALDGQPRVTFVDQVSESPRSICHTSSSGFTGPPTPGRPTAAASGWPSPQLSLAPTEAASSVPVLRAGVRPSPCICLRSILGDKRKLILD